MTQEQTLLFSLFGVVFVLLLWGRFRYDVVAFGALIVAVLAGLVPSAECLFRLWTSRPRSSLRWCWSSRAG
jgi:hypothetical protein